MIFTIIVCTYLYNYRVCAINVLFAYAFPNLYVMQLIVNKYYTREPTF